MTIFMMAGRSDATPIKLFSVDSYDLNIISFKLGNDIKFEMPRSSYLGIILPNARC